MKVMENDGRVVEDIRGDETGIRKGKVIELRGNKGRKSWGSEGKLGKSRENNRRGSMRNSGRGCGGMGK